MPWSSSQALGSSRINLSPFTKDFRVPGASIEQRAISGGSQLAATNVFKHDWPKSWSRLRLG